MNRYFVAVLLAFFATAACSQNPHYGSFHFTVGPFLYQCRESLINGTTHNNLGYNFTAEWNRLSPGNWQEAGLEFDWVRPKSPREPAALSVYFNLNPHYALLFPVIDKSGCLFYVGGNVSGDFRTSYYSLWDDSHAYWTTFGGLGAQCLARKKLKENKVFFAGFSLPLLGFMSRPPVYRENKMDDASLGNILSLYFQDLEAGHVVNYFNPDINAGLELTISGRFSLAFFLHFEYLAANASNSEKYCEMRKGLGIDFIF